MKNRLLLVGVIVLGVLVLWAYSESVVMMRGDYLFSRWIGVTETNKNWFHLFFWMLVGGTTPYIIWKLVVKKKELKGDHSGKT